ncbi:MAG: phage BR0599 family protein [Verrucomicrobiia bacterium]|jgi:uncharacterized phage protein (TIGR02218 family)
MTYFSRPIFTYPFNWAEALQKSFSFDLREMQIGFGLETYAAKQLHVVRGFEFSTLATCLGDIAWLEDFFNQLYGPLTGFWLPTDQSEMTVKNVVDSTHFDIVAQGLSETWTDDPAVYLWFTKLGITPQAAKITAVTVPDGFTERVTVDAPVALPLLGGDTGVGSVKVSRLLYVRLAGDEEQAEFITEQFQRRTIRVVELPTEYVSWETGERPVFLYHFQVKFPTTTDNWWYTSFAEPLVVSDATWLPEPITHGELKTGLKADTESLEIDSVLFTGNPLAQFVPFTLPFPLQVEILETTLPGLSSPATLFAGTIQSVDAKGNRLTANCVSLIDAFERKLPRHVFQTRCNYALFEPNTCKLSRSGFAITATITAIDGTDPTIVTVSIGSDLATHWFAEGWIEVGTGNTEEIRSVKDSTRIDATHQRLNLTRPLFENTVGASLVALPGCDKRNVTCQEKFNNFANFGGMPYLPTDNQIAHVANVNPAPSTKK